MNPECQCKPKVSPTQSHFHSCWMHGKTWFEILITQHQYELQLLEITKLQVVPCVIGCNRPVFDFEAVCSICGGDQIISVSQAIRYHKAELEILIK